MLDGLAASDRARGLGNACELLRGSCVQDGRNLRLGMPDGRATGVRRVDGGFAVSDRVLQGLGVSKELLRARLPAPSRSLQILDLLPLVGGCNQSPWHFKRSPSLRDDSSHPAPRGNRRKRVGGLLLQQPVHELLHGAQEPMPVQVLLGRSDSSLHVQGLKSGQAGGPRTGGARLGCAGRRLCWAARLAEAKQDRCAGPLYLHGALGGLAGLRRLEGEARAAQGLEQVEPEGVQAGGAGGEAAGLAAGAQQCHGELAPGLPGQDGEDSSVGCAADGQHLDLELSCVAAPALVLLLLQAPFACSRASTCSCIEEHLVVELVRQESVGLLRALSDHRPQEGTHERQQAVLPHVGLCFRRGPGRSAWAAGLAGRPQQRTYARYIALGRARPPPGSGGCPHDKGHRDGAPLQGHRAGLAVGLWP
mmetsp:Transcript_88221/g.263031  ORF Transcript_88221/g.263031 Transcript_88221/m.263031 type:complete len:420 (-) Transcript_88221:194-1453(-)